MKQHSLSGRLFAITGLLGALSIGAVHCGGSKSSGDSGSSSSGSTSTSTTTPATKSCDVSTQPVCPATPPSFATDVNTIFANYCLQCHDPNGVGASVGTVGPGGGGGGGPHDPNLVGNPNDPNAVVNPIDPNGFNRNPNNWDPSDAHDWSKYTNIKANATLIEQQVFLCNMPPSGAPALSDADRTTLLNWLKCGAPNN